MTTPSKTKPFMTSFVVHIEPEGKGMPRGFKDKAGNVRMHKNTATSKYEGRIAQAAADYFPEGVLDGPLGIRVLAVIARPKYLREVWGSNNKKKGRVKGAPKHPPGLIWQTGTPDADKVLYAVMDALAPYVLNDSQFCDVSTVKAYAEIDGRPRLEVTVWECYGDGPIEAPEEDSNELWEALGEADKELALKAFERGCIAVTEFAELNREMIREAVEEERKRLDLEEWPASEADRDAILEHARKRYGPDVHPVTFGPDDILFEYKPAEITFDINGKEYTPHQLRTHVMDTLEILKAGGKVTDDDSHAIEAWLAYVSAHKSATAMMERLEGAPDREAYDKEVKAVFPDKGGKSKATKAKQKATKPGRVDRRNLFA